MRLREYLIGLRCTIVEWEAATRTSEKILAVLLARNATKKL